MAVTIRVGDAEVVAISDKAHDADLGWTYPDVPAEAWRRYADLLTPDGMLALNFGCYLVRCDGRTILVDTGWGPDARPPGRDAGPGRLLDELAGVGVGVGDIDTVAFTHLHADHVGWNLIRDDGTVQPRFSQARYLVPEADWQHYASRSEMHPNIRDQAMALDGLGVMDLVGDGHQVAPSLVTVATPGHTPGHQSLVLESGGERLFILGDIVHTPIVAQETSWLHHFDWDPEATVAMRRKLLDQVEADGTLVALGHFPAPGLGRFARVDGRRVWRPI